MVDTNLVLISQARVRVCVRSTFCELKLSFLRLEIECREQQRFVKKYEILLAKLFSKKMRNLLQRQRRLSNPIWSVV